MSERNVDIQLLYKAMDATAKIIESQLDILADKGNTLEFTEYLLKIAELSIKLLKTGDKR